MPTGEECPKNSYCAAGVETSCPTNTFTYGTVADDNVVYGARIEAECMFCLPGKLCTSNDDTVDDCPEGNYCVDGVQTQCDAGYECATGTSIPTKCARGTFSAAGSASCTDCTDGSYCPDEGMETPTSCDATKICEDNVDSGYPCVKPNPCSAGQYAVANVCTDCPAGKWCWPEDMTVSSEIGDCSPGFVCQGGSDSPTPFFGAIVYYDDDDFAIYNGRAAVGYYTDSTSDSTQTNHACAAGTYSRSEGATECVECPPGYYCATEAIYSLTGLECDEGYVCLGGASTATPTDGSTGKICPQYYYCPSGVSVEIICENGKYAPNTGMDSCATCPDDHYCSFDGDTGTGAVEPYDCSTNNICIEGKSFDPVCPFGTYLDSGDCAECPLGNYYSTIKLIYLGQFCIDGHASTTDEDCTNGYCCAAGYECTGGAYVPDPSSTGGTRI